MTSIKINLFNKYLEIQGVKTINNDMPRDQPEDSIDASRSIGEDE